MRQTYLHFVWIVHAFVGSASAGWASGTWPMEPKDNQNLSLVYELMASARSPEC